MDKIYLYLLVLFVAAILITIVFIKPGFSLKESFSTDCDRILLSNSRKEGLYEGPDAFNEILKKQSLPFYIEYKNQDRHKGWQVIIYKRYTPIPKDFDMWDLFTNNWHGGHETRLSARKQGKVRVNYNRWRGHRWRGNHFNLFSSYKDAKADRNKWIECNFANRPNETGFPKDCGAKKRGRPYQMGIRDPQWMSFSKGRGYGWENWSFSLVKDRMAPLKKTINTLQTDLEFQQKTKHLDKILLSNSNGEGAYEGSKKFNKILNKVSLPFYIVYENPNRKSSHQRIVYKRYTPVNKIDMWDLLTTNWFSRRVRPHNYMGMRNSSRNRDFRLFSNLNDAVNNKKWWKFCNFDDPTVGFPRDCGPSRPVGGQWMSMKRGRGYGWENWSFTLYYDSSKKLKDDLETCKFDKSRLEKKYEIMKIKHDNEYEAKVKLQEMIAKGGNLVNELKQSLKEREQLIQELNKKNADLTMNSAAKQKMINELVTKITKLESYIKHLQNTRSTY